MGMRGDSAWWDRRHHAPQVNGLVASCVRLAWDGLCDILCRFRAKSGIAAGNSTPTLVRHKGDRSSETQCKHINLLPRVSITLCITRPFRANHQGANQPCQRIAAQNTMRTYGKILSPVILNL